ncbi:TPA: hypothetical protein SIA26_002457 [Aeromonas bestiarum]|nr:hypothetical protein [Aeromonas bestiarum]
MPKMKRVSRSQPHDQACSAVEDSGLLMPKMKIVSRSQPHDQACSAVEDTGLLMPRMKRVSAASSMIRLVLRWKTPAC